MGLRDAIQNNTGVGIGVAVVCLGIAAYVLFGGGGGAQPVGDWYYDLETGETVVHEAEPGSYSPITLSSGNQAVQLYRFACGDCETDEIFDGYLYKVTQEYIDAQHADPDQGPIAPTGGELVARVPEGGGDPQWFDMTSQRGSQITAMRDTCPGGQRPVICRPQQ